MEILIFFFFFFCVIQSNRERNNKKSRRWQLAYNKPDDDLSKRTKRCVAIH